MGEVMKICIYGAGAIGGYVGVLLAKAGADVSLIARGAHLEAIKANGLTLKIGGETKKARIKATHDPAELPPQDYVISALKAHQAWEVADKIALLCGPETAVVTMQNGLPWWYFHGFEGQYANRRIESVDPGDRQWQAIGPERVIGCTVYPAAEIESPGVIKHIDGDKFGLGEPTRKVTARVQMRNDIWLKLWGNLCFNPISALTKATLDVVATDPGTRTLSRNMMLEAEKIGRRIGVHFRVDVDRRINGAARVGAHRTSMLQDVDKGRPIELDALLTSVQELGKLAEVETPHINAVLALTQQMGRVSGIYPVFPEEVANVQDERVD
jgi:2-dehydropantoate 2-reductase